MTCIVLSSASAQCMPPDELELGSQSACSEKAQECMRASSSRTRQPWFPLASSLVFLAALIPSASCSVCQGCTAFTARPDMQRHDAESVVTVSRLRKSISYSSKMNHAVEVLPRMLTDKNIQETNVANSYAYTPAHSSSELHRGGESRYRRLRHNPAVSAESGWESPHVYTRLQTQLFPELRF